MSIRLRYVDALEQALLFAELRDEEQWLRDLFPYGAAIGKQWLEFVSCEACLTQAARRHFGPKAGRKTSSLKTLMSPCCLL
jgi:hypothetical protein